jgi:hypothetical protein
VTLPTEPTLVSLVAKLDALEAKVDGRRGTAVVEEPTLGEINRSIGRLEAKVEKFAEDHETRLRRMERWAYALPPTFLLAVAGLVAALVGRGP